MLAGAPPAAVSKGISVPSVPFVKRRPSKTGALDLPTRRKKMRLMMEIGADEKTRTQFIPTSDVPVRQYFHSRSNEPILQGEWDEDSDDEDDEGWLTKMSEEVRLWFHLLFKSSHVAVLLTTISCCR